MTQCLLGAVHHSITVINERIGSDYSVRASFSERRSPSMNSITKLTLSICFAAAALGCGVAGIGSSAAMKDAMRRQDKALSEAKDSMANEMAKERLENDMMANPDLPAWHEQREKLSLALGDRQFDKSFDRVFDSMTVALASLGCRVQNMERVSGYIAASIPELPPTQLQALEKDGTRQYAVANGYSPDILERKYGDEDFDFDFSSMMSREMAGLTLSMVKQGPETTKVKLRFDNVYYPALIDEYYKVVWRAVDKQMFLDKGLD